MFSRSFRRAAAAVCVAAGSISFTVTAQAGTIRHDRLDSQYTSLAAQSQYASVGQFLGNDGSSSWAGSGTLIASNWVLTAAHVVEGAKSLTFNVGGQSFTTSSIADMIIHPNWTGNLGAGYDIALVKFAASITTSTGIAAAQRYTGTSELGKTATFVGFGTTGTGLTGYQGISSFDQLQKRAGNNVIDALYNTGGKASSSRILLADFDNPSSSADNNYGSSTPLNLEYMTAPGDSGGAAFLNVNGVELLAGVTSFGWGRLDGDPNSDYGDVGGYTRVSSFNTWINGIIGTTSGGGGGGGKKPRGSTLASQDVELPAVPEPASFALLTMGLLALPGRRR
jgi:hypothetical protein